MFKNAFQSFFQNYFNFSGRATRSEFWCVMPIMMFIWLMPQLGIVGMVTRTLFSPISAIMAHQVIINVFTLMYAFLIIPVVSLFIRRLHDAGYSEWRLIAWWIIIPCLLGMVPAALGLSLYLIVPHFNEFVNLIYFCVIVYGMILTLMPSRK